MPPYSTLSRLAQIAQDQWGLVTRRQAERAGVSPATLQRLASASVLERMTQGVYHLAGAPMPDHLALRATWLQLAPDVVAWKRTPAEGVVSHRSAAAAYGLGHLPADRNEFTLPARRQSRQPDVRLHHRQLADGEWISLRGLLITRPSRIAADLLTDREDPEAVARSSPTRSAAPTTTRARSRTRSLHTPRSSDSDDRTASPSCAGCWTWSATRRHPNGWVRLELIEVRVSAASDDSRRAPESESSKFTETR